MYKELLGFKELRVFKDQLGNLAHQALKAPRGLSALQVLKAFKEHRVPRVFKVHLDLQELQALLV